MTTPAAGLVDLGNQLLAHTVTTLTTGSVAGPAGKIGVLTVRTPSTTLTVFVAADDLRTWADLLSGLADELDGSGKTLVQASPLDVAAVMRQKRDGKSG